jgi:hypothetical protein
VGGRVYVAAVEHTYRRRLRVEGVTLAACGALGSALLLLASDQARRMPLSTAGQLVFVAALLGWLGPRGLRRSIAESQPLPARQPAGGEPTPLWQAPIAVAGLSGIAGYLGGWDAGLRVTLGCLLVGLGQAFLLERIVAVEERASRRVFLRLPGSSWFRGTRLGYRAAAVRTSSPRLKAQPAATRPSPRRRRPVAATTRPPARIAVLARAARTSSRSGGSARAK